jgi:hypothetical protein
VTVLVDLRAVRPARLARGLGREALDDHVRAFLPLVRGAAVEPIAGGVRLVLRHDVRTVAALADLVRAEADLLPFFSFRLLADPPACWLEVTGDREAGALALTLFGELGR